MLLFNYSSIDELNSDLMKCDRCHYCSKMVGGRGPAPTPLMIVGQHPGATEVKTGIPFSGSSGEILHNILDRVGIREAYLTNVLKCVPTGENISTVAIGACKYWLECEVDIVKPKIIVALGKVAMEALGAASGEITDSIYGIPTIGTYHTAYLQRLRKNVGMVKLKEVWGECKEHWMKISKYLHREEWN